MISGEYDGIEVGVLFLDGFDGAPKDSLAAAAIVGVGMEESDGSSLISPAMEDI